MSTETRSPDAAPAVPLSPGARRYALGMLLIIYIFNFLDRQIVNILAEPIKIELGLADWQLGMLTGLAFALFYTVLGIPIARYAEKADRVKIISVAVAVWSAFTVMCGLATNFIQLLLARIGVGVGEAGCTPPAHSLITDYTPKEQRASALAFYSMGIPLGSLAGMVLGGLIADAYGWRVAFFVAGGPGIALAIITFLTLPEPRRDQPKPPKPPRQPNSFELYAAANKDSGAWLIRLRAALAGWYGHNFAPLISYFSELFGAMGELKSKKSFWWVSIGAALSAMVGYGHIAFYGSFYLRNHGEGLAALAETVNQTLGLSFGPIGFVGTALGLIIGICGAAGTYLGGILADRAARVNVAGYATVPAYAALITVIPFIASMLVGDVMLSFVLLALPVFVGAIWYGPVFASAQSLVQPHTRATAAAVLLFIINLVGLGLGPLLVGTFSDIYGQTMGAAEGIRWSMVTFGGVGGMAAIAFLLAARTLRDEVVG